MLTIVHPSRSQVESFLRTHHREKIIVYGAQDATQPTQPTQSVDSETDTTSPTTDVSHTPKIYVSHTPAIYETRTPTIFVNTTNLTITAHIKPTNTTPTPATIHKDSDNDLWFHKGSKPLNLEELSKISQNELSTPTHWIDFYSLLDATNQNNKPKQYDHIVRLNRWMNHSSSKVNHYLSFTNVKDFEPQWIDVCPSLIVHAKTIFNESSWIQKLLLTAYASDPKKLQDMRFKINLFAHEYYDKNLPFVEGFMMIQFPLQTIVRAVHYFGNLHLVRQCLSEPARYSLNNTKDTKNMGDDTKVDTKTNKTNSNDVHSNPIGATNATNITNVTNETDVKNENTQTKCNTHRYMVKNNDMCVNGICTRKPQPNCFKRCFLRFWCCRRKKTSCET